MLRLTGPARTPVTVAMSGFSNEHRRRGTTHISKVSVQDLHETVDDLQRYEFVVARADPAHEEQRGVSPVDDLCVCETAKRTHALHIHVLSPQREKTLLTLVL